LATKISNNPDDLESKLMLAELFMMEARISGEHGHYYPAALNLIDEVLTQEVKDPIVYRAKLDKASVLLSLHRFEEAKLLGEEALKVNPYSADIYGVLVDANVELGNYDIAVGYADKMVSIRPDLRSYSRISYLREIHGMVDEAIAAMKMAVTAGYPGMEQTEWARLTLGHLYDRYGMQDSALLQYALALEARPNYPFAIAAMADIYAKLGEIAKSDSLSDLAMHLIPEVGFYMSRANLEMQKGNSKKAGELTQDILEMLAEDETSGHKMNLEMAGVYIDLLKQPEQALKYALMEYEIRPSNIDVNKMLAELYYVLDNPAKSEEHLHKALVTGTKDPETRCLEGVLMAKTANAEVGVKQLQGVFANNPNLQCRICDEARAIVL
ncbi:MAG TPA: tetratricopeptide repeat protein, partial [Saprospiraceae bacterium]